MAASDWKQNVETYSSAREARQNEVQKRSEAVAGKSSAKKNCSRKFPKIYWKTPASETIFKKVSGCWLFLEVNFKILCSNLNE